MLYTAAMELTKSQYQRIEPFLPCQRGNVSLSNLQVLNAILYVAEQGCKWLSLVTLGRDTAPVFHVLATGCLIVAIVLLVGLLQQLFRPRIAYRDGHVLFYLQARSPIAVPVQVVEAFFLGQGPAYLPTASASKAESVNLVARLSQRATEWAQLDAFRKQIFNERIYILFCYQIKLSEVF